MRSFQSMNRPGSEEKKNTSTPWLTSGTVTKSSYRFDFCWNYWDLFYLSEISVISSEISLRHYKSVSQRSRRDLFAITNLSEISVKLFHRSDLRFFFILSRLCHSKKKKSWLMYVPQGWKITITSESFRFMFTIHIYFPLFLGMVMYDSEFKTKENKI